MFNLEQSIAEWCKQMLAAGIKTPVPLEELEAHLREEIERQIKSGLNEQQALESAYKIVGQPGHIGREFNKLSINWNRPLARTAWALFIVSFLLPSYGDGLGWKCAALSATAVSWPDFWQCNWMTIHLALLTLANLTLVISFFVLSFFSYRLSSIKWLRITFFASFLLVWSYIFLCIMNGGASELKIGCYVWGLSFLLLFLSTLKAFNRETKRHKEQYV